MSSRATSRPRPARWAATWAPMVPAPRTTAFRISSGVCLETPLAGRGAVKVVLISSSARLCLDRPPPGSAPRLCGPVQVVDYGLVLLLDKPPLDLQRGGELARLQGELLGEERDLLDLLELGQVLGEGVHQRFVVGRDLGLADQVLPARKRGALLPRPPLQVVEVRHHQGRREVALV